MTYTTEPRSEMVNNVLTVRFDRVLAGWEHWLLLTSDRHHDSTKCNRTLEKKHLEMAKERKASILDIGDLFDCMQGKFDPRKSYDELRPEYKVNKYFNVIVEDAANFYAPYAKQWLLLSKGNHELAVLDNNGIDIISNLAFALNTRGGNIAVGGIGGWVKFMFDLGGGKTDSINLKYHHGAGGGGPVTRGVIQTNRQAVYLPDAHIVVNGHTHDGWHVPIKRERLSNQGVLYFDVCHYLRTPTYADDYGDGGSGFHNKRWGAPKPMGCVWVRLYFKNEGKRRGVFIEPYVDVI